MLTPIAHARGAIGALCDRRDLCGEKLRGLSLAMSSPWHIPLANHLARPSAPGYLNKLPNESATKNP